MNIDNENNINFIRRCLGGMEGFSDTMQYRSSMAGYAQGVADALCTNGLLSSAVYVQLCSEIREYRNGGLIV